jgi:hypothetical protein
MLVAALAAPTGEYLLLGQFTAWLEFVSEPVDGGA